jgi:hypothetical protein
MLPLLRSLHAGVNTCHTSHLHELGASAANMAQDSQLTARLVHPFTRKRNTSIDYLGRVGKSNRMDIRHLLQFPLKFTPATRHFLCLCLVLKHFPLPSAMENACGLKFTMDSFENV